MITNLYTLYQANIDTAYFYQLQSMGLDEGIDLFRETGGGIVDPSWTSIMKAGPVAKMSSTAIASTLDIVAFDGLNFDADISSAMELYFQKYAQGGTRQTGSTAYRVSVQGGMVVPSRLSCRHGEAAQLELTVVSRSADGLASPLTKESNADLPTYQPANQAFTVGPIWLNTAQLTGVTSVEFDPGFKLIGDPQGPEGGAADGDPYTTFCTIQRREPMFRIRTRDLAAFTALHAAISEGVWIYFQKMAQGGTHLAAEEGEHIELFIQAGTIYAMETRSADGAAELEICVAPHFNGTDAGVQINTATAIVGYVAP